MESKVERLEVPSQELQFIRKQVLIEKLMSPSSSSSSSSSSGACASPEDDKDIMEEETETPKDETTSNDDGAKIIVVNKGQSRRRTRSGTGVTKFPHQAQRKTFKVQSSVLSRVKSFLPELRVANDELLRLPDPSKISLESSDEMDGFRGQSITTSVPVEVSNGGIVNDEPKPGCSKDSKDCNSKTFVEMSLALVEHSDSEIWNELGA